MRLPTLPRIAILSGVALVVLLAAVLAFNGGREPLLSGPFDAYISGQKGTRAIGCLEVPQSSESEIYVNALWVVDPPINASDIRVTGVKVVSETFVEVDQVVELSHPDTLAPPFALTTDSILRDYDATPLPAEVSVERSTSEALSFGIVVSIDPAMLLEPPTQGIWSLGIEAVTYEDSEGQEFIVEVAREIGVIFSDTPIDDFDTACADVNAPS